MHIDEPIYYKARRNTPSVDTMIMYLEVDKDTAKAIKNVLTGKTDLMTLEAPRKRQEEAYNPHDNVTLALEAVNQLMEGYGVEYIESVDDSCYAPLGIEYVNKGDTYSTTMIYDYRDDKWHVGSYGYVLETNYKRFDYTG